MKKIILLITTHFLNLILLMILGTPFFIFGFVLAVVNGSILGVVIGNIVAARLTKEYASPLEQYLKDNNVTDPDDIEWFTEQFNLIMRD